MNKNFIYIFCNLFLSYMLLAQTEEDIRPTDEFDRPHGTWILFQSNQVPKSVIQYKNGKRHGNYLEWNTQGRLVLRHQYVNDTLNGLQTNFAGNGNRLKVYNYKMGVLEGLQQVFDSNEKILESGYYVNGIKDGLFAWYFSNGKLATEYIYKNGKIEGDVLYYHEDGIQMKSRMTYVNNLRHGNYFEYYNNGVLKVQGKFKEDKKEGKWLYFSENATLERTEKYKKGSKKNRMKIGIVCYPTFGGSGVVATELGKYLGKMGHKVHFITYNQPVRLDILEENIYYHEVNVADYPLFQYQPYELALSSKMVDTVLNEGLDLLHVHYAIPHAYAAYMAREILKEKGFTFLL